MRFCCACRAALSGRAWECQTCGWHAQLNDGIVCLIESEPPEAFTSENVQNFATVDPAHFWFTARNRLISRMLSRHAPQAQTFFEAGCGTGSVLRGVSALLPHLKLTGAEASMASLRAAAVAAPAAELVYADLRDLPYDQEFDAVGAFDVLEHIADHQEALSALVRTAKPGGLVILTVPQHRWLWSPLDDYSGHQRRYTRSEMIALATASGLDVVRVTSFVSLLLPAMLASRWIQRGTEVVPGREFQISSRANRMAAGLMRVEGALIQAGLSLPAGGSLMLVARRPQPG
jgi:SAM-dependent methyltransferase